MDDRVQRARAVLVGAGIRAPVRAVGVNGEIAAVTGPAALREPLARLAPRLQALGFTYVALDLEHRGKTRIQNS